MTSIVTLQQRIDAMLEQVARKQGEVTPDMLALLNTWSREGLMRKLALLEPGGIPDHFNERCAAIDQDIEARMTPAEKAASKGLLRNVDAPGPKEHLLQKLQGYQEQGQTG